MRLIFKKFGGRRSSASRATQGGFTLVEMLVVISIIGLIMALVGPRVLNYLSESKTKTAKIQIQSFASSLDLFFLDVGRFPSSAEGLGALVQRFGVDQHSIEIENQRRRRAQGRSRHALSLRFAGSAFAAYQSRNFRNAAPRWLYFAFSSALNSANVF